MTDEDHPLRIAAWQAASIPADVTANLVALERAATEAAESGAELLITPEMFITGYNIGDDVRRLSAQHPLERVRGIAERVGIAIVAGGPELLGDDSDRDPIANAAWFIDDTGAVLAKHHKIQLFGDLDRDLFVAGDEPATVVDYRGHRIGVLICFDVEFPETVRAAARAGADLVAVPTAQMEPFSFVNEHLIRVRAWENGVHVAYANQHGPDGDLHYVGRSVIASPLGAHVAQAPARGEALLTAVIDRSLGEQSRAQNPYLAEVRSGLFRDDAHP
ncbi:carbon-nitrogen hydrolase family protein [Leucobacter japonicus]|uniref:carbon-nitrogen hydrolase family protein n=1 Tax=Leucobacter japonicus TaxID=1461259 RepID=UPI0006A76ED9|nr:carbon-nitrogen hydrolase family protein [Leucobacter japonicus]